MKRRGFIRWLIGAPVAVAVAPSRLVAAPRAVPRGFLTMAEARLAEGMPLPARLYPPEEIASGFLVPPTILDQYNKMHDELARVFLGGGPDAPGAGSGGRA